jgi:hypothetical protein
MNRRWISLCISCLTEKGHAHSTILLIADMSHLHEHSQQEYPTLMGSPSGSLQHAAFGQQGNREVALVQAPSPAHMESSKSDHVAPKAHEQKKNISKEEFEMEDSCKAFWQQCAIESCTVFGFCLCACWSHFSSKAYICTLKVPPAFIVGRIGQINAHQMSKSTFIRSAQTHRLIVSGGRCFIFSFRKVTPTKSTERFQHGYRAVVLSVQLERTGKTESLLSLTWDLSKLLFAYSFA